MISDKSLSHYDIHPKFTFSVFTTMRFHYSALVEAGYNFTINRCKVPSRRCLTLVKALLRCLGWSKNRPPRRMRLPTAARSLIQRSSVSSSRPALRAIAYSWWLPRRSVVAWSYCFGWTSTTSMRDWTDGRASLTTIGELAPSQTPNDRQVVSRNFEEVMSRVEQYLCKRHGDCGVGRRSMVVAPFVNRTIVAHVPKLIAVHTDPSDYCCWCWKALSFHLNRSAMIVRGIGAPKSRKKDQYGEVGLIAP